MALSLGKQSAQFEAAVALCEQSTAAAAAAGPASLAEQLGVQCTDGTAAADCVPGCSEEYHGYLMLLNIGGDDSKLSCELHHGLYSWVGAAVSRTLTCLSVSVLSLLPVGLFVLLCLCLRVCAVYRLLTDGGYIQTFFSAVVSGAAGVYVGMLLQDAGIGTDVTVSFGQVVSVSGDPLLPRAPAWGSGGFTVQERASLAMTYVWIEGGIAAKDGASLALTHVWMEGAIVVSNGGGATVSQLVWASVFGIVAEPNSTVVSDWTNLQQCEQYTTLQRSTTDGCTRDPYFDDTPARTLELGGDRWYRFVGPDGAAIGLATTPPCYGHNRWCQTAKGWLAGSDGQSQRGSDNPTHGRYPSVEEGEVELMNAHEPMCDVASHKPRSTTCHNTGREWAWVPRAS
jgi:hypothetical protein